jgi:gamma-glutamylcyclotransferase (GGCT)/AIG2-like uncharacterized protein YtfP
MGVFLFTYGSLQPGQAPPEIAPVVAGLEIAGQGYVLGTLHGLGPYPGAVLDRETSNRIPGTIYQLPDNPEVLRQLDEYEEYFPDSQERSAFLRELYPVHWNDGRVVVCWVYVLNGNRRTRGS